MTEARDAITRMPDTPLVQEARDLITRAGSPSLVNHSVRSYLLGAAYARKAGMVFDEEGLAAACMLHDLGLCQEHRDGRVPFQFVGARELQRLLEARGAPAERIEPLVEAIELHMQMLPRWSKGNVVGLLQVGAWMDITGLRRLGVRREAAEIEAAFPRERIFTEFPVRLLGSIGGLSSCVGLMFPGVVRHP